MALAALLGVFSTTPLARVAVITAVAAFGLLNIRGELSAGVQPAGPAPDQTVAGASERLLGRIASYLGTHLRVKLYPIQACDLPGGWCQFFGIQISSWYVPRPHARTFLLTDTRPGVPLTVAAPPASFGKPIAAETVAEGLSVYIYDHDIAADLSP